MRHKTNQPRRLRTTPAQDLLRLAIIRLLAEGSCVVDTERLAELAQVSITTARRFLAAGTTAGVFQELSHRIPTAHTGPYVVTEAFPGAPPADVVTMSALMHVASGSGDQGSAAIAYHNALVLHGLTEVAPTALHVVKIRHSIAPPSLPSDRVYVPRSRPAHVWMTIAGDRPVWLTLRSAKQLPSMDIVTVHQGGMRIPVTNPLRTLIDAWMHPDWCGGGDRVADSWRFFWKSQDVPSRRSDLAAMLANTAWPGLWIPLSEWAVAVVPDLLGLRDIVEKIASRGRSP